MINIWADKKNFQLDTKIAASCPRSEDKSRFHPRPQPKSCPLTSLGDDINSHFLTLDSILKPSALLLHRDWTGKVQACGGYNRHVSDMKFMCTFYQGKECNAGSVTHALREAGRMRLHHWNYHSREENEKLNSIWEISCILGTSGITRCKAKMQRYNRYKWRKCSEGKIYK